MTISRNASALPPGSSGCNAFASSWYRSFVWRVGMHSQEMKRLWLGLLLSKVALPLINHRASSCVWINEWCSPHTHSQNGKYTVKHGFKHVWLYPPDSTLLLLSPELSHVSADAVIVTTIRKSRHKTDTLRCEKFDAYNQVWLYRVSNGFSVESASPSFCTDYSTFRG